MSHLLQVSIMQVRGKNINLKLFLLYPLYNLGQATLLNLNDTQEPCTKKHTWHSKNIQNFESNLMKSPMEIYKIHLVIYLIFISYINIMILVNHIYQQFCILIETHLIYKLKIEHLLLTQSKYK